MRGFRKIVAIFGLIMSMAFLLNNSGNAYAAVDGAALTKKVLLRGLEKCYEDAYIPSGKTIDGSTNGVTVDDIMSDKGKKVEEDTIKVFSKEVGNSLTQEIPAVSCKQVFEGWGGPKGGSIKGLSKLTGKDFDISKVGFHATESVAQKWGCIRFPFSYTYNSASYGSSSNHSNGICFMLDGDNNVMRDNAGLISDQSLLPGESQGKLNLNAWLDASGEIVITSNAEPADIGHIPFTITCANAMSSNPASFDEISKCVNDSFGGESKNLGTALSNNNGILVGIDVLAPDISYLENGASNGLGQKWQKDDSGAALKALEYYGGLSNFDDVTFSEAEKYAVLQEYVKKVMDGDSNMGVDLESCYDSVSELGSDYGVLNAGKWCKINGWENHKDEKFNVIKNEIKSDKQALMTVTFEEVLKRIKKIDDSQVDSNSGLSVGVEGGENDCLSHKGAGNLGWIVCPLLQWMSDAATQTYEDYVAPSLQIEPTLFNGEGGDNVKDAWGTFRDIANVIFIILFLVVIFSQLTGIGIDNYGIKKILPRLVVAAIMINLSYIICILLVDVSNILGNGLKGIFDALGENLNPVVDFTAEGAESSGGSVSGVLASVGVLAAVGVMAGAIWANPAILLSLLVSALGVVVAIFFLFILLAARKAAIIVLTVISPLAVVAYMLPNTKSLFDKWWKFFEGLLLVYPIAGLLVGGGDYISRLLLGTSTGFLTGLTAMIVGIVPIFFVPTVLKGAFAAMGKVGGMLTGLGSVARGKVTGAARGSGAYKNLQNRGLERQTRLRAGIDANGKARNLSRAGVLLRGGRRSVAAARASYDRTQSERIREDLWMDPQYSANRANYRQTAERNEREKMYSDLFASRDRNTNVAELKNALAGTDAEKASAALSTLVSQGGTREALEALSGANWANMDAGVRSRLTQTMSGSNVDAMKSYSKYVSTGGGASFKDWASGTIDAAQRAKDAAAGAKDTTYAQHLLDGGENAMASYSKDEMQFVQANADAIRQEMENRAVANGGAAEDGKNELGAMLKNAAINSGDAKAQTVAEDTISRQLESGQLDINHLGITSENIGNMRGRTAESLRNGIERRIANANPSLTAAQARGHAENYLRKSLGTQISAAKSDSMIANKARNDTKLVLGM